MINLSRRFVAEDSDVILKGNLIELCNKTAKHIKVLRHNIGDKINVNEYLVEITKISKETVCGNIIEIIEDSGVPAQNITLIQSYLKSDKMEYIVQKAVEVGVKYVQPVISKNTVVKLDETTARKKIERLNKITVEAIGQCGRTDNVEVLNVVPIDKLDLSQFDLIVICHEKAKNSIKSIEDKIKASLNIAVLIGPEGGLSEEEVQAICKYPQTLPVVFGQRVLRAETASIYALSIIDYISQMP